MADLSSLSMGRLRIGLLAFVLALIVDLVDIPVDDVDIVHDGAAVLLFAVAAWGVGQKGAPVALMWLPAVAAALALFIELADPNWAYGAWESLAAFVFAALSLVLFCFGMRRLAKKTGLASTTRWRKAALAFVLLGLLPGLVLFFLPTDPRPELPFLHLPGSIDATWWKTILGWASVVGAVLASFEATMAALATWRSAGRRD